MLDVYKGKIYGTNGIGTEHDDSWTMKKIVIENGKVISATGEFPGLEPMIDLSANDADGKDNTKQEEHNNTIPDNTITNEIEGTNTVNNNTKLPQTGEETNIFANWLSIVILLGIFWLGSMILIDREKKKMTRK